MWNRQEDISNKHIEKWTQKWIMDLNVKQKTIKLLEENTAENLCDLEWHKGFLATTPKAQSIKGKTCI